MHPISYGVYVLSFYTLSAAVMRCIDVIPAHYRRARQRVYDNPVTERFVTDRSFRTHVSLYGSLTVNLMYVLVNVISAALYHTAWFWVLAAYYFILALMRFLLVRFFRITGIGISRMSELKLARICGMILLTVNFTLTGAVMMIMYIGKGFEYRGFLIYAMAAYTFYIAIAAAVNLVRYRQLGSPVMSMAKIINMAAALVSVLSLETAMLSQFGSEMSEQSKRIFTAVTGAGVSAAVIAMSVYSIVKNTREISEIMKGNEHGE